MQDKQPGQHSDGDLAAIRRRWMEKYLPQNADQLQLIESLIAQDWVVWRTHRDMVDACGEMADSAPSLKDRDPGTIKRFATAQRLHATALRVLSKLRKEAEVHLMDPEVRRGLKIKHDVAEVQLQREKFAFDQERSAAESAKTPQASKLSFNPALKSVKPAAEPLKKSQVLFQGQRHKKKQRKIHRLEQWIEVRILDGKTVTTLYPSNEKLIKDGQAMWPAPELVYRRINFPDGIPEEYRWTSATTTEQELKRGGCGIQRMTVDTWLEVIEHEKLREDGHIGPTGVGNLPRPMETGGCECPTCSHNRAILDARGT